MLHYGIWHRYILGFVRWVYSIFQHESHWKRTYRTKNGVNVQTEVSSSYPKFLLICNNIYVATTPPPPPPKVYDIFWDLKIEAFCSSIIWVQSYSRQRILLLSNKYPAFLTHWPLGNTHTHTHTNEHPWFPMCECCFAYPDSKVPVANMGPRWAMLAPWTLLSGHISITFGKEADREGLHNKTIPVTTHRAYCYMVHVVSVSQMRIWSIYFEILPAHKSSPMEEL